VLSAPQLVDMTATKQTESNSHQGDICLMESAKKIQIQQIQNQICPKNEKKGRSRQETLKVSNERNLLE